MYLGRILQDSYPYINLFSAAGIRSHALDVAEQEGMRRSLRAMEKADLILFVLDASRALTAEEEQLWQDIQRQHKRTLLILNKSDLSKAKNLPLDQASAYKQLPVSCKTGEGLEALKDELAAPLSSAQQTADRLIISNLRHYEALLRAQTELESALLRLEARAGGEIYAEHLRGAMTHLLLFFFLTITRYRNNKINFTGFTFTI